MARLYPMMMALTMGVVGSVSAAPALTASALGTPTPVQAATSQIEQYFNGMTTLQAAFTQTQSDNPALVQKGTFMANRPKGQFVWQYITPVKQKVVGTGTTVYYVDQSARVGDGQVTQLPLDAGMGRLLRGAPLNLKANGLYVASTTRKGALQQVVLLPTAGKGGVANQTVKKIELAFQNPGTAPVLAGFAATDALGVTMRISLTDVKTGQPIAPKVFAYTPPLLKTR